MAGELGVAKGYGKGFVGGAAKGAAAGGVLGPKGAIIGAGVGAVIGGVSGALKANKARKADEGIQAQDPRELARLAEINRIRKSIGAGTDPLAQQQINQARQTGASTQGNIARVTGGNVGATVAGLTRAQRGTQAATNQALAQSQQRLPFFENMAQQLNTRISQRALEVGLMRRDQAMAEKAAQGRANSANIAGGIAALGGMQGPGAGVSQPPLDVKQDVGFDQQSNGFVNDPTLSPNNEVFTDDPASEIVLENQPQQNSSKTQSPVGLVNPDLSTYGTDPKRNPFSDPMNDSGYSSTFPGGNPAEFIGGLLKDQISQREAAEAQKLAQITAASPGGIYPDEHTGF